MSSKLVKRLGVSIMGFVMGLLVGGGAVGLFWWAYATVVREESASPLAELAIREASVSREQVDAYIRKLGEQHHTQKSACLIVGVAVGDEERYFSFGALPGGAKPDRDTLFELASVGKTFTGLLLAEMVERKQLTFSTTLAELLPPEVQLEHEATRGITLLDLATQSSGIPTLPGNMPAKDPLNPYADYTAPLMLEELRRVEPEFAPGTEYRYSNFGFGVLGHVLALRADKEFEQAVQERICDVLDLRDTRMTLTDEQRARVAPPHDGDRLVPVWEDTTMPGAGSFLTSGRDMLKYLRAHWARGEGTLPKAMALATRKQRRTGSPRTAIGLGWHIDSENALDIVWHNGGAGGSRSYVAMLPEHRIGVCVLANWAQADVDALGRKLVYLVKLQSER